MCLSAKYMYQIKVRVKIMIKFFCFTLYKVNKFKSINFNNFSPCPKVFCICHNAKTSTTFWFIAMSTTVICLCLDSLNDGTIVILSWYLVVFKKWFNFCVQKHSTSTWVELITLKIDNKSNNCWAWLTVFLKLFSRKSLLCY